MKRTQNRHLEWAIANPLKAYGTPENIGRDCNLTLDIKLKMLAGWAADEDALLRATSENMRAAVQEAPAEGLLQRIRQVEESLQNVSAVCAGVILLIEENTEDAELTMGLIEKSFGAEQAVVHISAVSEAEAYIQNHDGDILAVLMGLSLPDTQSRYESFTRLSRLFPHVPIVVLTSSQDHDLSLRLLEEGAEDFICKNHLFRMPDMLRNAVEFAVRRHRLLKGTKHEAQDILDRMTQYFDVSTDQLRQFQGESAAKLKDSEEYSAATLTDLEESSAAQLQEIQKDLANQLKQSQTQHSDDCTTHQQVLLWMSGGYSIAGREPQQTELLVQAQDAVNLRQLQGVNALLLKEAQNQAASELKKSQTDRAVALLNVQRTDAFQLKETSEKIFPG